VLVSRLTVEEFCLVILTMLPLLSMIITVFRLVAGSNREEGLQEASEMRRLSTQIEELQTLMIRQSASAKEGLVKIEQQIVNLQRHTDMHGSRFGDLHKDLAGIVWELSKLRTDMARWQSLSYLAGQGGTLGAAAAQGRGATAAASPRRGGAGVSADLEAPAVGDERP